MTTEKRPPKGRVICMDCTRDMGPSKTPGNTHSVCPRCKALRMAEIERTGPILPRRQPS